MFCNQCEQANKGVGCESIGICGKKPEVAALQDILVFQTKGIGYLAHLSEQAGIIDEETNSFTLKALFTTVTNVDFDPDRMHMWIREADRIRKKLTDLILTKTPNTDMSTWPASARFKPNASLEDLVQDAIVIEGISLFSGPVDKDVRSLQQLLLYGLKGMAAYAEHAYLLGSKDQEIFSFFNKALSALNDSTLQVKDLVDLNMECGTINIKTMELLDNAHTSRFGHPEPVKVSTALKKGPAIIVSGHDLLDLETLLKQTEGKGINIYTHGEMLPAHGYPGLKKYTHLVGHFGTAWQNQQREFDNIPAAILFNTNCIQKPRDSYMDRVFTCDLVAWPGVQHIENRDYSPVINKALELGGFEEKDGHSLMTGFARNAVLSVADKVIEGVKSGAIKHFLLVGGCDGAKPGRNYYTELVEKAPKDTIILTLACGKFRFNDLELGDIGGIPRLLDIGQCNDAYSAIKIAEALANAFECGINDLPLSLVLSWYEQKAVVILLSLLSLGIKGIRLGPSLPAFITPNILDFLVKNFDIMPIGTVTEDLKAILG